MKLSKYIKEAIIALKNKKLKWLFLAEILTFAGLAILITIFGSITSIFTDSLDKLATNQITSAILTKMSLMLIFMILGLVTFWYISRYFIWQYINNSKFNKKNFWGGLLINLIYSPIFIYAIIALAVTFFYFIPVNLAMLLNITTKMPIAVILYLCMFILGIPFLYFLNINNIFFNALTKEKNLSSALKQFKLLFKNFPKMLCLFFYISADFLVLTLLLIFISKIPLIGSLITLFIYLIFNSWTKLLIKRVLLK